MCQELGYCLDTISVHLGSNQPDRKNQTPWLYPFSTGRFKYLCIHPEPPNYISGTRESLGSEAGDGQRTQFNYGQSAQILQCLIGLSSVFFQVFNKNAANCQSTRFEEHNLSNIILASWHVLCILYYGHAQKKCCYISANPLLTLLSSEMFPVAAL